jgi:RND family efflux transporter MFP subunit
MKKIILLPTLALLLFSCGKADNKSIESIIASNNTATISAKKAELQVQITQLEDALSKLDTVKEEVLVAIQPVKDSLFAHYLEIQGNINTKENVLIQPEIPGALVALHVKAGQAVSKGQVLGRVDDGGMSEQLASIENQYALAKTTFERQKNLWSQKIGSEIQFLNAQTQMVSAQKAVAQLKAQVAKTVIRAPFTGVIDEVFVERGEVVNANPRGLMRLVNLSNMYVSTMVPETYIGKLKIGTVVEVKLSALGKTYAGKVRQVASNINPSNRSFGIEIAVPNTDNLLRPNQVAKLKITDYVNPKALTVPSNSIQKDGQGNQFVFTATAVKGNTAIAKKTIITSGKSANNVTEILSGLHPKDLIVTDGANAISEGMKLNF